MPHAPGPILTRTVGDALLAARAAGTAGVSATFDLGRTHEDAATDAEVWVMAPMIATVDETRYFTTLCAERGLSGEHAAGPSDGLSDDVRHLDLVWQAVRGVARAP